MSSALLGAFGATDCEWTTACSTLGKQTKTMSLNCYRPREAALTDAMAPANTQFVGQHMLTDPIGQGSSRFAIAIETKAWAVR